MPTETLYIVLSIAVATALLGFVVGAILFRHKALKSRKVAEFQAEKIIQDARREAETLKNTKLLEAKEEIITLRADFEKQQLQRQRQWEHNENRLKKLEQALAQKNEALSKKEQEYQQIKDNLQRQLQLVSVRREELEKQYQELNRRLEAIANLTQQEAKAQLIESLKEQANTEAMAFVKQAMDEARLKANKEAKKIIVQSIQRLAAEQSIENSVSTFHIDSDDIKGQIIGREGRNIRTLEAATGVELIVDDTPETIVISGFDPLRREIARLSLQRLVADGRIHPARIEEVVAKTKRQVEDYIVETGERTVIELGIHGLHPELIRLVGRMRFRTSYGQNLLQHSKEVAQLCAIMTAELGISPKLAKRAGLLHDIGKVSEEDPELSHALLGMKLAERYGESPAVCNAIGAHHDEIEMQFIISPVVQACDAISGARPGARREITEQYIQRIKELENLAMSFDGVEKSYAVQAGRELRVIVEADKISDKQAEDLSFALAQRIQSEMTYPGQIKVTVIREKRAVHFAK